MNDEPLKCRMCGSTKVRRLKDGYECKECFSRWSD